jgi:hypothetical protein
MAEKSLGAWPFALGGITLTSSSSFPKAISPSLICFLASSFLISSLIFFSKTLPHIFLKNPGFFSSSFFSFESDFPLSGPGLGWLSILRMS